MANIATLSIGRSVEKQSAIKKCAETWSVRSLTFVIGAAVLGIGSAVAQTPPTVISPLRVEPDVNGVNLVSGKITIPSPSISIPAAPNLKFDGAQNAAPYVVEDTTGGGQGGGGAAVPVSGYSIHLGGGSSASFTCSDYSDCRSKTGDGSTFEAIINFYTQAGSGALYKFDLQHVKLLLNNRTQSTYYASTITYPNGEVISFSYDTYAAPPRTYYRPVLISSSLGYAISVSYQSNTFGTNGWGIPAQATLYATANPGTALARLTYGVPVNGGVTITDLAGRIYQCGGCAFTLGDKTEGPGGTVTLPTETAAALQVNASSQFGNCGSGGGILGSVMRDGIIYNYTYTNPRLNGLASNCVFDRVTVTGPNSYNQSYDIGNGNAGAPGSETGVKVNSITDSLGRVTSFTFDSSYRPVTMTMPEGNMVTLTYDIYGNVISKVSQAKAGSGLPNISESAFVDTLSCMDVLCYRPVWSRDGLNRQTDFIYNAAGQLTEQTDPADAAGVRRKTYITYENTVGISRQSVVRVCGFGTTCGTTGEFRTEYSYWNSTSLPSQERKIDPATGQTLTTNFSYDAAGRLLISDGPLAGTADAQYFRYDIIGRKTWEISAANADGQRVVKRTTFRDSDDKPSFVETGSLTDVNATTFAVTSRVDMAYDSRRNPVREALSSGGANYAVTDRSFDDRRRPVCETARMNLAALPAVGSSACTLGTAGTAGPDRITQKTYDVASQLLKVTKALGTADVADDATYTYSNNGKPLSLIDGKGNLMTLAYDGFDRQNRWTFPSPTTVGAVNAADYEAYGYDAAGNRTSFKKRDGSTLTYSYDNLNRVLVKTVPARAGLAATHTRSVYYGYDIRGLQAYARFDSASGEGVTMSYDAFGRLKSTATLMDGVSRILSNAFDVMGNRNELTWMDEAKTSFAYDPANRMTWVDQGGSGSTVSLDAFGYDLLGRKVWQIALPQGQTTSFRYDLVSRLNELTHDLAGTAADVTWSFGFNPASQIASVTRNNDSYAWTAHYNVARTYATNGLNQYTAAGGAGFTYDANGNLTSDGSTTFVYDIENRLVSASGAKTAGLRYDPLGRLYETTGAAGTTRFLYDGDELVAEFNGTGTLLRRYVHGSSVDDPVVWYEGAGMTAPRWLHADNQGSIISVTDASGSSIATNKYDEYGIPQSTNIGRFQYTGQAWIPELGMYHYKARIYSPTLGRFLQTDPIGYKDQINLYAYVGNDPGNMVDPDGLCGTGTRVSEHAVGCKVAEGFDNDRSKTGNDLGKKGTAASTVAIGARGSAALGNGVLAGSGTAAALGATLLLCGDTAGGCAKQRDYWYVTYTLSKQTPSGTVTYSGRTAGYGSSPQAVVTSRYASHHMRTQGFANPMVDRAIKSSATINDIFARAAVRGREQMLIDHFGGARSAGGTSGNAINGISSWNLARPGYMAAAIATFGTEF